MCNVNRVSPCPGPLERPIRQPLPARHGWMQFYCEDAQEAFDTVIQAYRIAENALFPVLVAIDGFFTSHFIEPVEIPDQDSIDAFPAAFPPADEIRHGCAGVYGERGQPGTIHGLPPAELRGHGEIRPIIGQVNEDYKKIIGRGYGLIEAVDTQAPRSSSPPAAP